MILRNRIGSLFNTTWRNVYTIQTAAKKEIISRNWVENVYLFLSVDGVKKVGDCGIKDYFVKNIPKEYP